MNRAQAHYCCIGLLKEQVPRLGSGQPATQKLSRLYFTWRGRGHREAIGLASASGRRTGRGDLSPEASLQAALEADALIDELLPLSDDEIATKVGPRLLNYDQNFYLRIAARADIAEEANMRENLIRVSNAVMKTMDSLARKSQDSIDSSATNLQLVVEAAAEPLTGEIEVPLSTDSVLRMKETIKSKLSQLDEGFLSSSFAWLRKASEGGQESMLVIIQTMLQVYASVTLESQDESAAKEENVLNTVISSRSDQWKGILQDALVGDNAVCSVEEFLIALQKKIEGAFVSTVNGSYNQRLQLEYLKEIEKVAKTLSSQ